MSIPKHNSPIRPERTAHAPYNFIPLPEEETQIVKAQPLPDQSSYDPDRFTGRIVCKITTRSPIYTRTAVTPAFYKKWKTNPAKAREMMRDASARREYAQFYHIDENGAPVIPGSSLRGMVRTLVEIISYGKMQWVTNEGLIHRTVADTTSVGNRYRERMTDESVRAGYIEKDGQGWRIRPALSVSGKNFGRIWESEGEGKHLERWHDFPNAWVIYADIRAGDDGKLPLAVNVEARSNRKQKYVYVKGGKRPPRRGLKNKQQLEEKWFVLGLPDNHATTIPIPDELVYRYRENLTPRQREMLGDDGVLKQNHPVFYLLEIDEDGKNHLVFFGHTRMFRLPYLKTPLALVPEDLRRSQIVDMADAIFGYVGGPKEQEAYASRVFFEDAKMIEAPQTGPWVSQNPITPRILSSPKPTSFQLYLTQQEPDDRKYLDHYASPPPHETTLRGHKFYWHTGAIGQADFVESENVNWETDTQHTQIKPVQAGVTFQFAIRFENLTREELGAILWAIQLPGEAKEYCHKLGMAKPYGLGAVQIVPELFLQNRTKRYETAFNKQGGWFGGESTKPADFGDKITAFEQHVLKQIKREGKQFCRLDRIRKLLVMLQWPGPDPAKTQYGQFQLERVMYTERWVLPGPLVVTREEIPHQAPHTAIEDDLKPALLKPGKTERDHGLDTFEPVGPARERFFATVCDLNNEGLYAEIRGEEDGPLGFIAKTDFSEEYKVDQVIVCEKLGTITKRNETFVHLKPV